MYKLGKTIKIILNKLKNVWAGGKIELTQEKYLDTHSIKHRITYADIFYLSHLTFGCNILQQKYDLVIGGQGFLMLFHVLPTVNKY